MKIPTKLALLIVTATVGIAFAASRQSPFVTKFARNDGDTRSAVYGMTYYDSKDSASFE